MLKVSSPVDFDLVAGDAIVLKVEEKEDGGDFDLDDEAIEEGDQMIPEMMTE